ncbi:MAG: substrate-binding domain-containing protein, partial [Collinsella aerofaciens]
TCGGNDKAIAAAAGRLPVVLLDRDVADGGIDLVTSNNRELVAGLVDALAVAGSERLCLLTEASDDSPVRRERAEAFVDELSRRGLAGEVVTLADGGATGVGRLDETIRDYAGKKLGLIAVNGLVFLRLTEALAQLGPSLPAGLKIATFDDYPWNHVLFGGVTTAAQDTLAIAERVVERLSERIDIVTTTVGDAVKLTPKRIEIPGHIEHRASTSR